MVAVAVAIAASTSGRPGPPRGPQSPSNNQRSATVVGHYPVGNKQLARVEEAGRLNPLSDEVWKRLTPGGRENDLRTGHDALVYSARVAIADGIAEACSVVTTPDLPHPLR